MRIEVHFSKKVCVSHCDQPCFGGACPKLAIVVDASSGGEAQPLGPDGPAFDSKDWSRRAAAVETRQQFGELLSEIVATARISVGAVKAHLSGTRTVYNWFSGGSLPRNAQDARRLADYLGNALARRHPGVEVADAVFDAWTRLAERRQEDAAARAVANRRAAVGNTTHDAGACASEEETEDSDGAVEASNSRGPDSTESTSDYGHFVADRLPAATPRQAEIDDAVAEVAGSSAGDRQGGWGAVKARWARRITPHHRKIAVAAVALSLVAAIALAFTVTRVVVGPRRYTVLPCAESIPLNTRGFVRMNTADGPPGDPRPRQQAELRVQIEESVGWIAYAYLTQPMSDRDQLSLDWSDVYEPQDSQIQHCPAQLVNQVQQTAGVRARSPLGAPRWFRVCATVPGEFRVVGRGPTSCGSWKRPDD